MKRTLFIIAMLFCAVLASSCTNNGCDTKLLAVKSNDRWGYVDNKGSFAINPQFDKAHPFFNGLARVESGEKVGYIGTDGKYVVQPQYQDGTDFSEGYAFVVTENSYPICINTKGKVVFTLERAKTVYSYSDGLARFVNQSGQYGYIDFKGNTSVISLRFDNAADFHDGLAAIQMNDKWGFVDKKGHIVIPCQFVEARSFHEGLAAVSNGESYGFIDRNGNYVINPQFESISDFSNGLAPFSNGKMIGYIDKTGKYVINPQFDEGDIFCNGLACVRMGNRYGYIDKDGKMAINPQFDGALSFHGNIALIESNDMVGFIDKQGKYIINPQFDAASFYIEAQGYVNSTYYDVSDFVNNFLGTNKSLGSVILNTFKQGSTLKSVAEDKYFNSANVDGSNTLKYYDTDSWSLEGDVVLDGITFNFSGDIYDSYYDYYNGNYNWGATLLGVGCIFSLRDKAQGKGSAVASAIINQLKTRLSDLEFKTLGVFMVGYSTQHNQGILISYDDNVLEFSLLTVGKQEFNEFVEYIQQL